MDALLNFFKPLISSIVRTNIHLLKMMIPITIAVKIIEELGGTQYIAMVLEPLMQFVGLPSSLGIVWATTLLTNLFGGMIVFINLPQEPLTVAQVTVLASMMLVAHAIPIESRIIQKAGVRLLYVVCLRIFGAILVGFLLHHIYSAGDFLTQTNQAIWNPNLSNDDSLTTWVINQLKTFVQIFAIIAVLMTFLKLLKITGLESLIAAALKPVLSLIGLSKNTTSITLIGALLGIIYGGGLLINESQSGKVSQQEVFGSLTLLALLHSIIEDTILLMLLGAHISGVLFFRILFALVVTSIIIRLVQRLNNVQFQRFCVYPLNH